MNNLQKTLTSGLSILLVMLSFTACDDDFSTVGNEIIENNNFSTDLFSETIIETTNRKLPPVQTNGLPVYQLGTNVDPLYGTVRSKLSVQASLPTDDVDPEFGEMTQAEEDEDNFNEQETILSVYLNIPFFSSSSINDDNETVVEVDSIYGNRDAVFQLKIEELTYFLRNTDTNGDPQAYYSDQDFTGFSGTELYNNTMFEINENQVEVIEVDAAGNIVLDDEGMPVVEETLSPRIRVELNSTFFQQRILDNEGSIKLTNNNVFRAEDLFRGINITTENNDDLLMLLDFSSANIEINYSYQRVNEQNNTDPSDDTVEAAKSSYVLNLSSANIVNTFEQIDAFPDVEADNDNLYLKGGEGAITMINLFGPDTDNNGVADQLEDLRENNWLINDANLVFYVNQDIQPDAAVDPQRIYLYNMRDYTPLEDYIIDQSVNSSSPSLSKVIHGGILERDDSGEALRYKIRITEHINNLIRKDSTNVQLGLVASSDIRVITSGRLDNGSTEIEFVPTVSVMNPFGTVLYGPTAVAPEDKRLKLEIFYSESEND